MPRLFPPDVPPHYHLQPLGMHERHQLSRDECGFGIYVNAVQSRIRSLFDLTEETTLVVRDVRKRPAHEIALARQALLDPLEPLQVECDVTQLRLSRVLAPLLCHKVEQDHVVTLDFDKHDTVAREESEGVAQEDGVLHLSLVLTNGHVLNLFPSHVTQGSVHRGGRCWLAASSPQRGIMDNNNLVVSRAPNIQLHRAETQVKRPSKGRSSVLGCVCTPTTVGHQQHVRALRRWWVRPAVNRAVYTLPQKCPCMAKLSEVHQ
mmetsp:Transcript_44345/g.117630  ORF Transcript_44345/g.117630 Transcript_44345/m.117630 type:complete len:262 (+) Transcript_44345:281-1066(+)